MTFPHQTHSKQATIALLISCIPLMDDVGYREANRQASREANSSGRTAQLSVASRVVWRRPRAVKTSDENTVTALSPSKMLRVRTSKEPVREASELGTSRLGLFVKPVVLLLQLQDLVLQTGLSMLLLCQGLLQLDHLVLEVLEPLLGLLRATRGVHRAANGPGARTPSGRGREVAAGYDLCRLCRRQDDVLSGGGAG